VKRAVVSSPLQSCFDKSDMIPELFQDAAATMNPFVVAKNFAGPCAGCAEKCLNCIVALFSPERLGSLFPPFSLDGLTEIYCFSLRFYDACWFGLLGIVHRCYGTGIL